MNLNKIVILRGKGKNKEIINITSRACIKNHYKKNYDELYGQLLSV